jgi:hypothetical protein
MIGNKLFATLAITTALSALGFASAAAKDFGERHEDRGAVVSCSLAGVNPAFHPEIFGNRAVAQSYGFIQSRDGTWHVAPNCRQR